ncbi:hypothetical protein [Lewinella sp. W8]|uniref:hypothetical protein n=1 Tax=Lewinella sp. W8 TaxID=2528208 RepID=UPI0010682B15|nr:hypothetical protein [Lewinella sp. W8]MTB53873.1 hypothetical protein [Lewinella sp. W8]
MKIKSVEEFAFPQDLESIVRQEGYWEDESFEPLIIVVDQVQYKGEEMLSYQVQFDLFRESGGMDGNQWEDMFRNKSMKQNLSC